MHKLNTSRFTDRLFCSLTPVNNDLFHQNREPKPTNTKDMTTTEIQNNHAILQAAAVLFAETGYGQTDVETIAEKAEVDPAFIYSENTMKNQNHSTRLRSLIKGSILIAAAALSIGSLQAKDYQLADHEIRWTGSMPAKTHEGKLTLKSIEADITDTGKVTSLKAVVDMTAINVTDLEGKSRDKLTGHLESDDFFHVEKYPTATFVLDEHKTQARQI